MKIAKEQDERVLAQKRKIASDGFGILWAALLISVLAQQYFFKAPFAQYAVEIILFIAASFYLVIRNIAAGNNLFRSRKNSQSIVIINSLVCGITVTVINTVLNYVKYRENAPLPLDLNTALVALVTFISATLIAFIPFELLYQANKKKQQAIESQLDEEE